MDRGARPLRGTGDAGALAEVPLASEVRLGLGDALVLTRSAADLRQPAAWRIDEEAFRGYVGPFSALKLLVRDVDLTVTVGQHPHCASGPVPPPAELTGLRRVSLQPRAPDGCLNWWTVDAFVTDAGAIEGITLDRWEP